MRTHSIPFLNMKKKIILNYPKSAAMGFVPRESRRSSNSRGKRAISVRAIEILLYIYMINEMTPYLEPFLTIIPI